MAVRLAGINGVPAPAAPDPEALSARTTELVSDLVEPTKAEALESLREGPRALGIASAWVRTRLTPLVLGEADRESAT